MTNKKAPIKKASVIRCVKRNVHRIQYAPKKVSLWLRFLTVTLAAIIVTFSIRYFVHPTGIYTGGLRTIQQIIHYGVPSLPEWSTYLMFFGLNLPLVYIGWKYVGKWFTILTLYFLLIQTGFDWVFENVKVFEDINILGLRSNPITNAFKPGDNNVTKVFIGATLGGLLYGLGVAIAYIAGGSTGGTKFIVAWINKKTNRSLGKLSVYIAIIMISIALLINGIILKPNETFINTYFSAAAAASIIFVIIQGVMQVRYAPREMKTRILIHTSNIAPVKKILEGHILEQRLWYTFRIWKDNDKKRSNVIVLTVDKRESQYVLSKLTKALPSTLITYSDVRVASKGFEVRGFD